MPYIGYYFLGALWLLFAALGVFACMRSSQISRQEEMQSHNEG